MKPELIFFNLNHPENYLLNVKIQLTLFFESLKAIKSIFLQYNRCKIFFKTRRYRVDNDGCKYSILPLLLRYYKQIK